MPAIVHLLCLLISFDWNGHILFFHWIPVSDLNFDLKKCNAVTFDSNVSHVSKSLQSIIGSGPNDRRMIPNCTLNVSRCTLCAISCKSYIYRAFMWLEVVCGCKTYLQIQFLCLQQCIDKDRHCVVLLCSKDHRALERAYVVALVLSCEIHKFLSNCLLYFQQDYFPTCVVVFHHFGWQTYSFLPDLWCPCFTFEYHHEKCSAHFQWSCWTSRHNCVHDYKISPSVSRERRSSSWLMRSLP